MTVRMVGEKLAREAGRRSVSVEVDDRKEAGADAAAAIQAIRKQAASMSDVLGELSVVVAALSNDVEEIIKMGVTTELLAKAEATFNLDLEKRMQDAVLPLFADGEDGTTALSWAQKVTKAAMPAVTFEAVEALRELAGKAIQDGLMRVITKVHEREVGAEAKRQADRKQSIDGIENQLCKLEAAVNKLEPASGSGKEAETDASIAAYEKQERVYTSLMKESYAKVEELLEQQGRLKSRQLDLDALDGAYERADEQLIKEKEMTGVDEDSIQQHIVRNSQRVTRNKSKMRDIVMDAMCITKGDGSKEQEMEGKHFNDLIELKLGSAFVDKAGRSKVKGKRMMDCIGRAMAIKPDAVFALAPALAAYAKITVPMTTFVLPQVYNIDKDIDSNGLNQWGMGKLTRDAFTSQTINLYKKLNEVMRNDVQESIRPDTDFEHSFRDIKPQCQGVFEDGMSFIYMWRTQQEFLSDAQMEATKNKIRDIKTLFYSKTLAVAIPEAQRIIRDAKDLEAVVSWDRTGKPWVECIAALHSEIKADIMDKKLHVCPSGVDSRNCIEVLQGVLADIYACATRNAMLVEQPKQLDPSHELYYSEARGQGGARQGGGGRKPQAKAEGVTAGACCMIKGCGKDLDKVELNDHKVRKLVKPGSLVRALCKPHQNQAARSIKGMKWSNGEWLKSGEIVVSKSQLRRIEIEGKAVDQPPAAASPALKSKSDSEEEGEKVPEPKKELELHVAAGVSATDMMSEWLGEMKAAREREKRLMELLERQQQQMEKQGSSSSGDEIAYEAGRKATLLELSEKLAVKAGPTFTFAKPMKDRDD